MIHSFLFILSFLLFYPQNLPVNIPAKILESNTVKTDGHPLNSSKKMSSSELSDTLLSPIESMFVTITHEKRLRQIGYESLQNRGNARNIGLGMTPSYRLGPGDELIIYLTGAIENILKVTVDKSGMIYIPGLGTVSTTGLTLQKLEDKLNTLAKQKWANVRISVSPGRIRGIQVYLTGEVKNPGVYTLKSHTTLLDLIFFAGGILKTGTLRNIEILHANGHSTYVDLYPYIFGGRAKLPYLKDGDIVTVSTLKSVIAVDGCIHRKGIYEITKSTTLKKILNWAGILPLAQNRAEIHRIERDSMVIFSAPETYWAKTYLKPGDYVYLPFSKFNSGGYVFIKGNIKKEGYYTFKEGLVLRDLILHAGGFLIEPYKDILIYRKDTLVKMAVEVPLDSVALFRLKEGDSVIVLRADILEAKSPITITGYVKNPGLMEWAKKLSVKKAVLSAIPRKDADMDNIVVYSKNTGRTYHASTENWNSILLSPGDIVYVPRDTLKHRELRVLITGEIRFPGIYTLKKGSTVQDIINIAGGITKGSYIEGTYIKRKIVSESKKKVIINTTFYSMNLSGKDSSIIFPEYIKKIISDRMENIIPASPDMTLLNGDTVVIPPFTPYVYITGAVLKPYVVPYEKNVKIHDLVQNSYLRQDANKKGAFCMSVNGRIHRGTVKPGDIIFVPFKERHEKTTLKDLAVISSILYQIAMAVFVIYQVGK